MELGIMTKPNYNKKKFQDLKETIELKNAEIDELNMQLATKDKEINKFKNYITKQKYYYEPATYNHRLKFLNILSGPVYHQLSPAFH